MKKVFKNGTYNAFTLVAPAVLLIIATPLLVRWLGMERYGIWVICSTLLGLFGLLDFGLKETAITFIPKYLLSSNEGLLVRHLRSLFGINLVIGVFSTSSLYLISSFVATRVFTISQQYQAESILTFRILAIGLLPSLTINLLSAVAMGFQRFDLSTALVVVRNIVTTLGALIVAASSRSLSAVIGFSVVVSWLFMLLGFFVMGKAFPGKRLLLSIPRNSEAIEVLSFGGYSFLTNVSLLSMGVFDKLIIGALINPAAVALYSIPMSLVSKVEQVLVKFAQALFPHFSEVADSPSEDKKASAKAKSVFDISVDASLFVGLGAGVLLFILAEPILRLWMGADFAVQAKWIFRGLLIGYSIKLLNVLPTYILYSLKKPGLNAIAYTVSGVMYAVLLLLLINKVSLGALSFCSLAYLVSFVILVKGISGSLQKNIVWHLFPYLVAAICSGLPAYFIANASFLNDIWKIVTVGLIFSICYLLFSLIVPSGGVKEGNRSMRFGYHLMAIVKPLVRGQG